MFSTEQKMKEAAREARMRERVYQRLIEKGTMSRFDANRNIAIMRAIEQDYREQLEKERGQTNLFDGA